MDEQYDFFNQLRRGEQRPDHSLHAELHRIPSGAPESVMQVHRLLRHAEDELGELVETIGNILRWHDRDQILAALTE